MPIFVVSVDNILIVSVNWTFNKFIIIRITTYWDRSSQVRPLKKITDAITFVSMTILVMRFSFVADRFYNPGSSGRGWDSWSKYYSVFEWNPAAGTGFAGNCNLSNYQYSRWCPGLCFLHAAGQSFELNQSPWQPPVCLLQHLRTKTGYALKKEQNVSEEI